MDSSDPGLRFLSDGQLAFDPQIMLSTPEQTYLNSLLRASGFTITQAGPPDLFSNQLRENFKVGAQNGPSSEGRGKRIIQHNQLFKEEPWTCSTLRLVQRLIEKVYRCEENENKKKFRDLQKPVLQRSLFKEQLEGVKKKLGRGDYIGISHFEADMEKIWSEIRQREKPGSSLYKASIQLEMAFNEGQAGQQNFEAEVKKAALSKSKSSLRRKKVPARKGSDLFESKTAADHEAHTPMTFFEHSLAQKELEEKLPMLKSKDIHGVRKILKKFGCQSSSSTLLVDRKVDMQQLPEPALRAILAFIRRKVDRKPKRPIEDKSKGQLQAKGLQMIEENCHISSNSSFLTGTGDLTSDSDH